MDIAEGDESSSPSTAAPRSSSTATMYLILRESDVLAKVVGDARKAKAKA